MPAPQRGGERGDGLAVIVERDIGDDVAVGGGRDGVGMGEPGRIEMVEPEGPLPAVRAGNGIERTQELLPERGIFGLRRLVGGRFGPGAGLRKQCLRRESGQRVGVRQVA